MTIDTLLNGQPKTVYKKLDAATVTDIYEAKNGTKAFLSSASFCNITTTAADISLIVNDGTTSFYILNELPVAGDTTEFFIDHPVGIKSGSKFQVLAETANAIDVALTIVELTGIGNG